MEMRRYCHISGISDKDHVTNEKERSSIKRYIGPQEDLLSSEEHEIQTVRPRHKILRPRKDRM